MDGLNGPTLALQGAGAGTGGYGGRAGSVTVPINATIANDIDIDKLARKVVEKIQRMQ
jgi:hypothetical protein